VAQVISSSPDGQMLGHAAPYIQVRLEAPRDGEHALVGVDPDDGTGGPNSSQGHPRNQSRARPDVDQPVAFESIDRIEHRCGPLCKKCGDEERLVDLGGAGRHLSRHGAGR
jgi:hypothetical protein